ncbi:MAG: hypothetical protein JSV88_20320, partial [Candidatus Aminicenantes bacterium]
MPCLHLLGIFPLHFVCGVNKSSQEAGRQAGKQDPAATFLPSSHLALSFAPLFASGGQGGRFLKKLPPLDPPA